MKCPRCGEEYPSGAPLCPRCGAFVSAAGPSEPRAEEPRKKDTVKLGLIAAVVLLAIIVLALLIRGKSVTQAGIPGPNNSRAVTNAPPPGLGGGPGVANAPTPVPGIPKPIAAPPKPGVPQDVLNYLNYLKAVEEYRQKLLRDTTAAVAMTAQTQSAQSMMDAIDMAMDDSNTQTAPKSAQKVSTEVDKHIRNWQALIVQFDKYQPVPRDCQVLAGQYRNVLAVQAADMQRILAVFNSTNWTDMKSIQQALSQLQAMKSDPNLQGGIDQAVEASDQSLTAVADKFGIKKPFDIKKEGEAGGSITGG